MSRPDAVDSALIAALKREMSSPSDDAFAERLRNRLGESLPLGPGWAAGATSKPLTAAAATGKAAAPLAATSAGATGAAVALKPLMVFVGALFVGGAVTLGASSMKVPRTPARKVEISGPLVSARAPSRPLAKVEAPATSTITPMAEETLAPTPPKAQSTARGTHLEARAESGVVNAPSGAQSAMSGAQSAARSLAEQQVLLDVARRALARGDGSTALEALAWHRSRFPRTQLEEEREALTIKALRAAGRGTESSAKAKQFTARYPRSVFSPGLTDAEAIP